MVQTVSHDPDVLRLELRFDAPQVNRRLFSIPMIGGTAPFAESARVYTSGDQADADVQAGDLTPLLGEYVNDGFSQELKPEKIIVGNIRPAAAQVSTLSVDQSTDGDYEATINATTYTHTAAGETDAQIATALALLIDADPNVSAVAAANVITITALVAGVAYALAAGAGITATITTANVNLESELDKVRAANSEWFGFSLTSRSDDANTRAFAWAKSREYFFAGQSSSAAIKAKTPGNLMETLKDAGAREGYIFYRSDDTSKAAWKLLCNRNGINLDQGKGSYSFIRLVGESAEELTETEKQNLLSLNAMIYLPLKGINCTRAGKSPLGPKVDNYISGVWFNARIGEAFVQLVVNEANRGREVSHDNPGFERLLTLVKRQQRIGERIGHFQPGSSRAKYTRKEDLSDQQNADRVFDFDYGSLLQGGVERFEGRGYPTLDAEFLQQFFGAQ